MGYCLRWWFWWTIFRTTRVVNEFELRCPRCMSFCLHWRIQWIIVHASKFRDLLSTRVNLECIIVYVSVSVITCPWHHKWSASTRFPMEKWLSDTLHVTDSCIENVSHWQLLLVYESTFCLRNCQPDQLRFFEKNIHHPLIHVTLLAVHGRVSGNT